MLRVTKPCNMSLLNVIAEANEITYEELKVKYLPPKQPGIIQGASVMFDSDLKDLASQAAHFYDNEILGYQAQSYRGKSSKKEWWYVAASKNCPDTGRRGPSTISLKNLC